MNKRLKRSKRKRFELAMWTAAQKAKRDQESRPAENTPDMSETGKPAAANWSGPWRSLVLRKNGRDQCRS